MSIQHGCVQWFLHCIVSTKVRQIIVKKCQKCNLVDLNIFFMNMLSTRNGQIGILVCSCKIETCRMRVTRRPGRPGGYHHRLVNYSTMLHPWMLTLSLKILQRHPPSIYRYTSQTCSPLGVKQTKKNKPRFKRGSQTIGKSWVSSEDQCLESIQRMWLTAETKVLPLPLHPYTPIYKQVL